LTTTEPLRCPRHRTIRRRHLKVHRDKVASYIDAGEAAGATLVVDGRQVTPDGGPDGFWLGPTLLDHVTPAMSVYTDEIFGPVLSVVRVESNDEALELINTNPTATAPPSSPTTAAPPGASKTKSRSAWSAST
jgi:acyl-CoA reductase-like NAD-dependent aldehyde dehydrogenase